MLVFLVMVVGGLVDPIRLVLMGAAGGWGGWKGAAAMAGPVLALDWFLRRQDGSVDPGRLVAGLVASLAIGLAAAGVRHLIGAKARRADPAP